MPPSPRLRHFRVLPTTLALCVAASIVGVPAASAATAKPRPQLVGVTIRLEAAGSTAHGALGVASCRLVNGARKLEPSRRGPRCLAVAKVRSRITCMGRMFLTAKRVVPDRVNGAWRCTPTIMKAPVRAPAPVDPGGPVDPVASFTMDPLGTDNYKAIWNEFPDVREPRTWLALRSIRWDGTTWAPTPLAAREDGRPYAVITSTDVGLALHSAAQPDRVIRLHITALDGPTLGAMSLRQDSAGGGVFGPLVGISSLGTLAETPARWRLTLVGEDAVEVASATLEYRYDAAIALAPAGDLEHNGPGGRFWVDGVATATMAGIGD